MIMVLVIVLIVITVLVLFTIASIRGTVDGVFDAIGDMFDE